MHVRKYIVMTADDMRRQEFQDNLLQLQMLKIDIKTIIVEVRRSRLIAKMDGEKFKVDSRQSKQLIEFKYEYARICARMKKPSH